MKFTQNISNKIGYNSETALFIKFTAFFIWMQLDLFLNRFIGVQPWTGVLRTKPVNAKRDKSSTCRWYKATYIPHAHEADRQRQALYRSLETQPFNKLSEFALQRHN